MSIKYCVVSLFVLATFSHLISYGITFPGENVIPEVADNNRWFYLIIVFLLLLVFLLGIGLMRRQAALRKKLESNQDRTDFFNAFTYEIRTYLTLVSSPIDKLLEHSNDSREIKKYLKRTKRNSKRVISLLTELLDFRKLEEGQIVLEKAPFDIVRLVREGLPVFEYLWQEKNLFVSFQSSDENVVVNGDIHHIEKILFNLLSNAYRFAANDSKIVLEISQQQDTVLLKLKTDGGLGIPPDEIRYLLFNFFQSRALKGRNIKFKVDLAISKKIIELHQGTIKVDSTPLPGGNNNTELTIILPKGDVSGFSNLQEVVPPEENLSISAEEIQPRHTILIVEDNEELLSLLSKSLNDYTIITCNNGSEALDKCLEIIPDLVISDIIMPELNGLDLCKAIKSDPITSHIPIILLTAKAGEDYVLEGLAVHADHYMVKPFNLSELRLRVINFMNMIDAQRNRFVKVDELTYTPESLKKSFEENQLKKIIEIINENLTNPDFGVDHLARETAMSRVVLYKKIRSLTGMTVNDFIKKIRFLRAADMLKTNAYSVSEVAELVGFNDRRYFSKEFRRIYGNTPVEYAKLHKSGQASGEEEKKDGQITNERV